MVITATLKYNHVLRFLHTQITQLNVLKARGYVCRLGRLATTDEIDFAVLTMPVKICAEGRGEPPLSQRVNLHHTEAGTAAREIVSAAARWRGRYVCGMTPW